MGLKDLIKAQQSVKKEHPTNPKEIFLNELVHEQGYEYLRENQARFLDEWYKNKNQRDVVGILNTGAGKTLIGQLMLLSKMYELKKPVIYLCPDNQLVNQVLIQAKHHHIPSTTIPKDNSLPLEFLNAEAILVTTFERLYNGRSIFGVSGRRDREIQSIGALVIDDAHSCIKKAREKSSITFEASTDEYRRLCSIFIDDIEKYQGYHAKLGIVKGDKNASRMVPYWSWNQNSESVKKILEDALEKENPAVLFSANLVFDFLESSQCFISGDKLEISPMQNPLEKIPDYNTADFRFVLSATFNNNFELISELGLNKHSVLNPIKVDYGNESGEKLILAPKRIYNQITDNDVITLMSKISKNINVVVLTTSSGTAKKWIDKGAIFVDKNNIEEKLNNLKQSKNNFLVLANRYDGIDLSGDMCRILIIDGLPTNDTARNKAISFMREGSSKIKLQKAQIIEQGIGRSVRSSSDYSALILMGDQLINFISLKDNQSYFSPETRAQMNLMFDIIESTKIETKEDAMKEILDDIKMCINREPDWISYYKESMKKTVKDDRPENTNLINLAEIEDRSFRKYRYKDYVTAASIINDEILQKSKQYNLSDEESGWYHQIYAEIISKFDQRRANDIQKIAKEKNNSLFIPINGVFAKKNKVTSNQAKLCLDVIQNYTYGNDYIIEVERIKRQLIFSNDRSSEEFEKAIKDLGYLLGYRSTTPDNNDGIGPDNFWETSNYDFIIECKNRSETEKISRANIEQLLHSNQWYENNYLMRGIKNTAILFQKTSELNFDAEAKDTFVVIDDEKLELLKKNLESFSTNIGNHDINEIDLNYVNQLLIEKNFIPEKFITFYTNRILK